MQCPCGGETFDSSHEVTTKAKAQEWAEREIDPPVEIVQTRCSGCGRQMMRVFKDNELINKRG